MQATPYPEVNTILDNLLSQMQRILGDKLVGLYLYGSLVYGGYDSVSDIDLLAAIASELNDQEFGELQAMHNDLVAQNRQWEDRIEVAYLSVTALKTFRSLTSPIAVISPGEPFHYKEAGKDWLMNWYLVRERGRTLFGPPPERLIDPISKEEFIQAVQDHAKSWREWVHEMHEPKAQAYSVLTLSRALYAQTHGEQPSKKQAAAWMAKEYPQWSALIQKALLWREIPTDQAVDPEATYPETVRFVQFVIERIA